MSRRPARRVSHYSALGVLLFALGAALLSWGLLGKPTPGDDAVVVRAVFDDVPTLIRFDRDVRVAGANVGTIGRVRRVGDRAELELRLRPGAVGPVRADASAVLRPHTLFDGSAFVELRLGTPAAPPLGNRPIRRTGQTTSLDRALRLLDAPTRAGVRSIARDAAGAVDRPQARAARRTIRAAPSLLRDLGRWARAARGSDGTELTRAIGGMARTVDGLGRADVALDRSLRRASTTGAALRRSDADLDATLRRLPATLAATGDGGRAVEAIGRALRPLSVELRPGAAALAPTLRRLRPLLRDAPAQLRDGDVVVGLLQRTLAEVPGAAPPLTALVRELQPTVEQIQDRLLPFLGSKTPAGATVVDSLAGLLGSGAGTLSPLRPMTGDGTGGGHYWQMTPQVFQPTQLGCAQLAGTGLKDPFSALGICVP